MARLSTVSEGERQRRYGALRTAMGADGLSALVVCSNGSTGRGRVRYVSDLYLWGGEAFVILPLAGDPILIQPAYVGSEWAESIGWIRDNRSATDPAQATAEAIADLGLGSSDIGIAGMASAIGVRHLETLRGTLTGATLRDATRLFEEVCAVKSDEEIRHLRHTSAVVRRAYQALDAYISPGMTERQVISEVHRLLFLHGAQDGFAHIARSGGLPMLRPPTSDAIEASDCLSLDIEYLGPEGYALELSHHVSFGPPPDAIRRIFDIQAEAFQSSLEAIRPGVSSLELYRAADSVYRKYGHHAAGPTGHGPVQFHAHGIGLEFEEPPWVPEHNVIFQPGMVVSLHPHLGPEDPARLGVHIEDNVLVTPHGAERLTYDHSSWTVL